MAKTPQVKLWLILQKVTKGHVYLKETKKQK